MAARRQGIERDRLAALVAAGLSQRRIAAEVGVSQATVRHWLRRYGLRTAQAERRRTFSDDLAGASGNAQASCPRHGRTMFKQRPGGGWRCLACRSEQVAARRRRVKAMLVAEAGGRCALCGYARSVAALQFHHLDPAAKAFSISDAGVTRSLERARAETAKCILLCANCHAEVETGIATIPAVATGSDPDEPRGPG